MTTSAQLHLGAMLTASGAPDDERAWLDPDEPANASVNPDWYREVAQLAEEALLDFVFVADAVFADLDGAPHYLSRFEPLSVLSYLAAATRHIGLVGTFSTSYQEPYNLARMLLSLDHLSGGRAGWNVVTSLGDRAARNFGLDGQRDHATRYARAAEALEVIRGLWHTYDEGSFPRDRASGQYLDRAHVRTLEHRGEHFAVAGPLNIERSRQGEPVVFQAGHSARGRALAAASADCVFGMQTTIAEALEYRAGIRAELAAGRPEPKLFIKVMLAFADAPGHADDARRAYLVRHGALDELTGRVARAIERDVDESPITEHDLARALVNEGTWLADHLAADRDAGHPLRASVARLLGRDRLVVAGTGAEIADALLEWRDAGAADGFIVQVSNRAELRRVRDELVPALRERGAFRDAYPEQSTLRSLLGIRAAEVPAR
jgi:FMN-dependent oxidoreductase (nitrilotriacetate monooxygenase family)